MGRGEETAVRPKWNVLRRLYDWVVSWADHRSGVAALFGIAFLESSVFPIPPDVLLIAMALGRPRRGFYLAAVCMAGSVIGGMFGYLIGLTVWHVVREFFFTFILSESIFQVVAEKYQTHAFWAIFGAGFSPIPYKVFTIAAGVFDVSFPIFLVASVLGRGGRFFLVAAVIRWFGDRARTLIEKHFGWATMLLVVLGIGGYVVLKYFF